MADTTVVFLPVSARVCDISGQNTVRNSSPEVELLAGPKLNVVKKASKRKRKSKVIAQIKESIPPVMTHKYKFDKGPPICLKLVEVPAQKWEQDLDYQILQKTRLAALKYVYKGYGNLAPPGHLIQEFVEKHNNKPEYVREKPLGKKHVWVRQLVS